jgi:hypothetical protein
MPFWLVVVLAVAVFVAFMAVGRFLLREGAKIERNRED